MRDHPFLRPNSLPASPEKPVEEADGSDAFDLTATDLERYGEYEEVSKSLRHSWVWLAVMYGIGVALFGWLAWNGIPLPTKNAREQAPAKEVDLPADPEAAQENRKPQQEAKPKVPAPAAALRVAQIIRRMMLILGGLSLAGLALASYCAYGAHRRWPFAVGVGLAFSILLAIAGLSSAVWQLSRGKMPFKQAFYVAMHVWSASESRKWFRLRRETEKLRAVFE